MATPPPDDDPSARDPVEVLVEEYFERRRRGESSSIDDFARRVPGREDEFREMVDLLGDLESAATTPSPARRPGTRLGRFDLARLIGRGGMGAVYEAHDRELDRTVALKILPGHATLDAREIERFRREAEAAARLHHPHIVPVYGVGEDDGTHWIAMQLVPGESLDHALRAARGRGAPPRMGAQEIARHGLAIAQALACAHAEGVLHRDVKPSNLLLDVSGAIWITDFGLAKTEGNATLTRSGEMVGTPRYMAPEAFQGWADPRTDVWGAGVTLYELLAGRPAFDGADRARLLKQISDEEPAALRRLDAAIPVDLETIVHKCIQKEPSARYGSARELADDLERFLAGARIRARPPTRLQRLTLVARRHRKSVAAAAAMALVIVALSIAWAVTLGRKNANLQEAKEKAETNLGVAVTAIDRLLGDLSEYSLARSPALNPLRRQVLLDALELQQRLLAAQQDDARLKDEVAGAHLRIGEISKELDRLDESRAHYDAAVRLLRELLVAEPASIRFALVLSRALDGRSLLARETGDLDTEIAELEESRALLEGVARRDGDGGGAEALRHLLLTSTYLCDAMTRDRRPAPAAALLNEVIARVRPLLEAENASPEQLATLIEALARAADAEEAAGDAAAAVRTLESARPLGRRLVASASVEWSARRVDAAIRSRLAAFLAEIGRGDEAQTLLAAACDDLEQLAKQWPMAGELRSDLARGLARRSEVALACDPAADVVPLLRRALEVNDGCRADWPADVDEMAVAVNVRADLAFALDRAGREGEACAAVDDALKLADHEVAARKRGSAELALAVANACCNRSSIRHELGELDGALADCERGLELLDWLLASDGGCWHAATLRVQTLVLRGIVLEAVGAHDRAGESFERAASDARRLSDELATRCPGDVASGAGLARGLVRALNLDGNARLAHGDRDGAATRIAEAVAAAEAAHARWPDRVELEASLAMALGDSGNVALLEGHAADARATFERALDHVDAVLARTPRDSSSRRAAGWIVDHLAVALEDAHDLDARLAQVAALADRLGDDAEMQIAAARLFARAASFRHDSLLDRVTGAGAQDPLAAAAVERLRAAAKDGLDVAARAKDDPALAILTRRDDYRKFLASLSAPSH